MEGCSPQPFLGGVRRFNISITFYIGKSRFTFSTCSLRYGSCLKLCNWSTYNRNYFRLELTSSYEYAIAATFPIVVCSFITSRIFANSVFDKQLISRGVAITKGREQIRLNEALIKNYVDNKYTKFKPSTSIENAIKLLTKQNNTEGYIVSEDEKFIGKISLINLINKKGSNLMDYSQKNHS